VLNNSVLAGVKKLAWMGTIGGFLLGGLLSFLLARLH
jgi:hypothetical protein